MNISWQNYKDWLGEQWIGPEPQTAAPEVALWNRDTRSLGLGDWYLPIVGESFDGHKFIAQAIAAGAGGFLYQADRHDSLEPELLNKGFAVKDSLVAIQKIAHGWRKSLAQTTVVALTGSAGKTTVKELTSLILQRQGHTVATYGSYNNELGVPLTLISIPSHCRFAVLEMGARKEGNIRFLVGLAEPDISVVLNVGSAHLGIFGSRENLLRAKTEMFRDSADTATLVGYSDDPTLRSAANETGKKTVFFGTSSEADVWFDEVNWNDDGSSTFTLKTNTESQIIKLAVAHEAYPINVCAAAAIALSADVPLSEIAQALKGFSGLAGRYKVHRLPSRTVIDDVYNANPESMRVGLLSLAKGFPNQPLALVLGDMLELGDDSAEQHKLIGQFAGDLLHPARVWCVGDEAKHLADGLKSSSPHSIVEVFPNTEAAQERQRHAPLSEAIIYLKASKGIWLPPLLDDLLGTT